MIKTVQSVICFIILLFCGNVSAQTEKINVDNGYLQINGVVKDGNKSLDSALIVYHKNKIKAGQIYSEENGKFQIDMELNNIYVVEITKPGMVTKKFEFDTHVPEYEPVDVYWFDFIIGLFPAYSKVDASVLNEPLGKIRFYEEFGDFDYDYEYTKELKPKVVALQKESNEIHKQIGDEYSKLIELADKAFKAKQYQDATYKYEQASKIYPDVAYPKDKINEINTILADLDKKQKEYDNTVAFADKFFNVKDYERAKTFYQKASGLKPDEKYPKDKINEVDKLLAGLQDRDKSYAKAIAEANKLFNEKSYDKAKSEYQVASNLKPDEQYPKDKINEINKAMANLQDIEKTYANTIANADKFYNAKDYKRARNSYEEAGNIKPEEKYPKDRIIEIDKILADSQKRQDEYDKAIADANQFFNDKSYEKAKTSYQTASNIKPEEKYPQERISQIDKLLADIKNQIASYDKYIADANKLFDDKDYVRAKSMYVQASSIKPEEKYPKDRISKIDQILGDLQNRESSYNNAIAEGDKSFNSKEYDKALTSYQQAATIKPNEKYPKDRIEQIGKINKVLALQKETDDKYNKAIGTADKLFDNKEYDKAITAYQEASLVKPGEKYPKDQINEINKIQKILADQKSVQEAYSKSIADADKLFIAKDYEKARDEYKKASNYKPNEQYPKDKIAETTKIIQNQAYGQAIADADRLFNTKDYTNALASYQIASKIKPEEQYPKNKINEINSLLANLQANEKAYDTYLAEGNNLFKTKDYEKAKLSYQQAASIKPNEQYPKSKIAEIDKILTDMLAQQKQYDKAITDADILYSSKTYDKAIESYKLASSYKPNEQYPKQKITEINQLISQAKQESYDKAIANAEQLFNDKNYPKAINAYEEASNIKPEEEYPKQKIIEINRLVSSIQQGAYNNAIAEADNYFNTKSYKEARESYKKAGNLKPDAQYPKDQIAKINNLLAEQEYNNAIVNADRFFNAGNYQSAKTVYQEARRIKPEAQYPKDKLAEIAKVIKEKEFAEAISDITSEFIEKNTKRTFTFPALQNKGKNNYILVKAKNLSNMPFNIILNYGKDNSNSGGMVMKILDTDEIYEYKVLVGSQTTWLTIDNNWLSLSPVGGNVEILSIKIEQGD